MNIHQIWKKVFLFFCLSLLLAGKAFAISGTVYLSNGKSHQGKITFSRQFSFQDIFRGKQISLTLDEIYRIDMITECTKKFVLWGKSLDESKFLEKNYIMAITKWDGTRYWTRFHMRVTVHQKPKKLKWELPTVQVAQSIQDPEKLVYVKQILLESEEKKPPSEDSFLSLAGVLKPEGVFRYMLAVHQELGIVFQGKIDEEGRSYFIPDIMPGSYDLFMIGKEEIVFCLSEPSRKDLMDKLVEQDSATMSSWIKPKESGISTRKLLHIVGRYSDTKAIILEEKAEEWNTPEYGKLSIPQGTKRLISLWMCYNHPNRGWQRKNCVTLYEQKATDSMPKLLLDPRLSSVVLPLDGGKQRYDYLANEE